ncbi:MAG: PAS domain-containing sensor histidine kinase, partial [Alphaproteobacteria bacterium]|nr:PAS domain-containing sensor histidine kinase [Alphaproteobacteria bacterium]
MANVTNWLLPDSFLPHGHCYLWRPDVLWLHVGSDALIATSYYAIPLALAYFVRRRHAVLPYWWVPALFAMFIFLCGTTHLLNIWTVWKPDYIVDGVVKLATGIASAATAVVIFAALPRALALRTPIELQREVDDRTAELMSVNARLREEITARERTEAALRENELRVRLALEAARAATWVIDFVHEGRERFDARGCELAGLDAGQREWPPGSFCRLLHPEDGELMRRASEQTHAQSGPGPIIEYRIVRPDGEVRWLQGAGIVQRDEAGRPQLFIGVSLDITDRKRLEEELRHTIERLAESDRRKDEFLATLAHELRNPLAPIANGVQLIKLTDPSLPTVRRAVEMMERQLQHLVRLVDDLLDVSRIARGKAPLRREPLDLEEVLQGALESAWSDLDRQRLELIVQRPGQPIRVEGDRDRLTQVFANILSNAAKYCEERGTVWVKVSQENGQATVSIRDTGIGIPPEALEKVFEMFSQLRQPGYDAGGLGIGLALVRQLVQLHGGTVEARSAGVGHGSEFII